MVIENQIELIDECLELIGQSRFFEPFSTLISHTGAIQLTIHSYKNEKPSCLLSHNFKVSPIGEMSAQLYLNGWYLKDPIYNRINELPTGSMEVRALEATLDEYPDDYKEAFTTLSFITLPKGGLGTKMAVLCCGQTERLVVNIYFPDDDLPDLSNAHWTILGRLALLHFESPSTIQSPFPPVLAGLSDRERQVCLGILAGKKAERIASDINIAPSTVVTYRKRAYEKLGISSRASLFEICNS